MTYLPIVLREDNFPQINFKKVATNRNKKFSLFLNVVKGVFSWFARKPQIENGTTQDTPYREYESSCREGQDEKTILTNV
jgi:hypothetical protein